jgi:hypothetical protein
MMPSMDTLSEIFGLTGNSAIDLIIMIKIMQNIQFYCLVFILYYFILYIIDISKLESYLIRVLPPKLVLFLIKILNKIKKINLITIICLTVLCLIGAYLNGTYLEFLLNNFDGIIQFYLKNK